MHGGEAVRQNAECVCNDFSVRGRREVGDVEAAVADASADFVGHTILAQLFVELRTWHVVYREKLCMWIVGVILERWRGAGEQFGVVSSRCGCDEVCVIVGRVRCVSAAVCESVGFVGASVSRVGHEVVEVERFSVSSA